MEALQRVLRPFWKREDFEKGGQQTGPVEALEAVEEVGWGDWGACPKGCVCQPWRGAGHSPAKPLPHSDAPCAKSWTSVSNAAIGDMISILWHLHFQVCFGEACYVFLKEKKASEGQLDGPECVVCTWKRWMKCLYFAWLNLCLKTREKAKQFWITWKWMYSLHLLLTSVLC